jgi:Uma2 family endonuclease
METMRKAPDLGIPEVKPALLERRFRDLGDTGTEWRFYLLPEGEAPSSLVPDVAYVSYERMPETLGELREKPTIAPDIAVEILLPTIA